MIKINDLISKKDCQDGCPTIPALLADIVYLTFKSVDKKVLSNGLIWKNNQMYLLTIDDLIKTTFNTNAPPLLSLNLPQLITLFNIIKDKCVINGILEKDIS